MDSSAEDEGHSSGKENPAPPSFQHQGYFSPTVIPASDDECTPSGLLSSRSKNSTKESFGPVPLQDKISNSTNRSNNNIIDSISMDKLRIHTHSASKVGSPLVQEVPIERSIPNMDAFWSVNTTGPDLKTNIAPEKKSNLQGISIEKHSRSKATMKEFEPTAPIVNSIFTGKEHDLLYRKNLENPTSNRYLPNDSYYDNPMNNVTSTPMLSNIRKLKPFDDLDLTAISEDTEERKKPKENATTSTPTLRPKPNTARIRQIINSSSSSSSETEVDSAGTENYTGRKDSELEVFDISSRIDSLQLGGPQGKKQFSFKAKKPTVVNVESDSSDDFASVVEEVEIESSCTDESSPEAIYVPPKPHRVDPSVKKGKGLLESQPRIKFIDLPVAATGPAPGIAGSTQFRVGVQNAISKLAETIQSIPPEGALAVNPRGLRVDLYDHQRYGLEWLCWREQHFPGGGILADEMGLGKTIMIIALVLKSKMEGVNRNKAIEKSWISSDTRNLVPSRSTLVVVPAAVLSQWETEIYEKAKGVRVLSYHGPKRTSSAAVLAQYDFVISTYQTVGSEIPKLRDDKYEKCKSPLLRIHWERIVLDEGHVIRNSKTLGAQAVCRLSAYHRWVVTGTPVHNKPADLQSIVGFLRLSPFDDEKVWNFWIGLKAVSVANSERLSIIGKALILRRTKEEVQIGGGNCGSIPPKTVIDIKVELTPEEKQIYDHLHSFAESQFKMFLKNQEQAYKDIQNHANNYIAGSKPFAPSVPGGVNFTHLFVLILRLRQASVLPFLITTMLEDETSDSDLSEAFDPLNNDDVISKRNPVFSEQFQSAKLRQLYQDLEDLRSMCRAEERPMEKVVVVSQWTSLLDIVHIHLAAKGFSLTTISGKVKLSDRAGIKDKFNKDPNKPQIMLLSLGAGGTGLNLVGANHLFFLDMHWNPQLELQAQDRIHRFGQTKNVTIKRYICVGTMEERVLNLQQRKLEFANSLLTNSKTKAGTGLSLQEMRQLFDV